MTSFNLFQFVDTFFGYTYMYVTFYQNLLKLNVIPRLYDSKHIE